MRNFAGPAVLVILLATLFFYNVGDNPGEEAAAGEQTEGPGVVPAGETSPSGDSSTDSSNDVCDLPVAANGEEKFLAYDAPAGLDFFGPDSGVTNVADAKEDFYADVRTDPARLAAYMETLSEREHRELTERFIRDRDFWQKSYKDFCKKHESADRVSFKIISAQYDTQTFERGASRDEIPRLRQASLYRENFEVLSFEWDLEDGGVRIAHYRRGCDWQVIHRLVEGDKPGPEPEPTPTPTPTPEPEEDKCFKEDGTRIFDGPHCGTPDSGPEQQDREDPGRTDGYEPGRAEDVTETQENPDVDPNKEPTKKGSKSEDYPDAGQDTRDTDGDGVDDETVDDSAPGGTNEGVSDPEHHSGEEPEPSEQPTNSGDTGGW